MSSKPSDSDVNPQSDTHDDACVYALEQLMKGHKPAEIRKSLIEAGYSPKQSDKIMRYANDFRRENDAKIASGGVAHGNTNQLIGFACLILGLVVSIGTYLTAAPGQTHIFTFGLFSTGFILIFRGQAQANQK